MSNENISEKSVSPLTEAQKNWLKENRISLHLMTKEHDFFGVSVRIIATQNTRGGIKLVTFGVTAAGTVEQIQAMGANKYLALPVEKEYIDSLTKLNF